jgi:hypothetical protein
MGGRRESRHHRDACHCSISPHWDTNKGGTLTVSSLAFRMGPAPSTLLASVSGRYPLACLLKHWKDLDPDNLKKTLTFLCSEVWPKYPLGDQKRGPPEGSIHYNTIPQLDLFCTRKGKWTKIPYAQLLFSLRDHSEWLNKRWIMLWSVAPSPLRKLSA